VPPNSILYLIKYVTVIYVCGNDEKDPNTKKRKGLSLLNIHPIGLGIWIHSQKIDSLFLPLLIDSQCFHPIYPTMLRRRCEEQHRL
jgi:hypothetical protein